MRNKLKASLIAGTAGAAALGIAVTVLVAQQPAPADGVSSLGLVPQPANIELVEDAEPFELDAGARIVHSGDGAEDVAGYLAELLRPAIGAEPELQVSGDDDSPGAIRLEIDAAAAGDGPESYELAVDETGVTITADAAPGLFAGVQTLRQLLPPQLESGQPADWLVPAVNIRDEPRFAYRGAMLDVARHFFDVDEVKRYIDDIATLKLNHLHLHLTDDQGWRIQIDSWPNLTEYGSRTEVGGGEGGYYTKEDFREIVRYAQSRFIAIVPEIDVPGHTNAALASYPELTCDGKRPEPYTGIQVGFSSLCIDSEITYRFLDDVFRELAEMSPGPYLHIGGDEAQSTTDAEFIAFVDRAARIAADHGKTVIGWHDLGRSTNLPRGTIGQYWGFSRPDPESASEARSFVEQGGRLIMSPADVAYLDMKYDRGTRLGLVWADGPTTLPAAAGWDPAQVLPDIGEEQLLGVEAPLWSETLETIEDIEYMAFPRIAAIAELAWSPAGDGGGFEQLAQRLAVLGERWGHAGIGYYRAPEVSWTE